MLFCSIASFTFKFCKISCTIIHIIFETNSIFRVEWRNAGRDHFLFFGGFSLLLALFLISGRRMGTGQLVYEVLSFSPIRASSPLHVSLLIVITLRLTCGERKICSTIKKSQNFMNMIVAQFHKRALCHILFYLLFSLFLKCQQYMILLLVLPDKHVS